jgi:N-acetylglutamate synthase-like GNAT family acetyltransferase
VSVRRAGAGDAGAIAGLLAQLGHEPGAERVAEWLVKLGADERSAVLVAERDGAIVGLLTLHVVPVLNEPGGWCRITALVVDEGARRRGAGRELVTAAEAFARTAGCSRIEVTSARHRAGAHEFYRGLGFGQVSEHFLKRMAAHGG